MAQLFSTTFLLCESLGTNHRRDESSSVTGQGFSVSAFILSVGKLGFHEYVLSTVSGHEICIYELQRTMRP